MKSSDARGAAGSFLVGSWTSSTSDARNGSCAESSEVCSKGDYNSYPCSIPLLLADCGHKHAFCGGRKSCLREEDCNFTF